MIVCTRHSTKLMICQSTEQICGLCYINGNCGAGARCCSHDGDRKYSRPQSCAETSFGDVASLHCEKSHLGMKEFVNGTP